MTSSRDFGCFCFGCAVGAAVAMIFAPKSGPETVNYLRDSADKAADTVKQRVEAARDAVNDAVNRADTVMASVSKGLNAASKVMGTAAERVR
jgi:gas vesicle protein